MFNDNIDQTVGTILITKRASDPDSEPNEIPIAAECFRAGLGTGQRLEWKYRGEGENAEVWDQKNGMVIGKCQAEAKREACPRLTSAAVSPAPVQLTLRGIFGSFVSEAWGQATKPTYQQLFEDLKSDDTDTRRIARDQISLLPLENLRSIFDVFDKGYSNYRVKLGVSVALAQMLRADKKKAEAISGILTDRDRDRDLLLSAAGDSDRTVRVYATEFLFDLSDPGAASLGIKRAADSNDETARYKWLFQAQGGWLKLAPEQKRDLRSSLDQIKSRSEGKTRELLGKFV